jgi:hypothetical protein
MKIVKFSPNDSISFTCAECAKPHVGHAISFGAPGVALVICPVCIQSALAKLALESRAR